MFGTMDAGAVTGMVLTIIAVLGAGIAAVRWIKAQNR